MAGRHAGQPAAAAAPVPPAPAIQQRLLAFLQTHLTRTPDSLRPPSAAAIAAAVPAYHVYMRDGTAVDRLHLETPTEKGLGSMRDRMVYQLAAFLAAYSSGSFSLQQEWQLDAVPDGHPILAALDLLALPDPEEVSRLATWLRLPGAGFTVPRALLGDTEVFRWLWCFGHVLEMHTPGGGRAIGLLAAGSASASCASPGRPWRRCRRGTQQPWQPPCRHRSLQV